MKEINTKKNLSLKELILQLVSDFDLKETSLNNIRLRTYDPKLKVKL